MVNTKYMASKAGYKYLLTYKYASVIYDLTVEFTKRFLPGRENVRLREQMVSAARSGKEEAANLLLTLINKATYLLDRQISALEEKFIKEGGYTENLFKKRLEHRQKPSHRQNLNS